MSKKIIEFSADDELVALLKTESARTGATVAEICRRAVRKAHTSPVTLSPELLKRINASPNFEKC